MPFLPPGWKKKWKRWNNSYPWIPPRTGEWPEKDDERQVWSKRGRRPMSKKAQRHRMGYGDMEINWYPVAEAVAGDADPIAISAGPGSDAYALRIAASAYKATGGGTGLTTGQSGKLFRFDGKIELFLDPNEEPTNQVTFNHAKVMYVWLKNKLNAQSFGGGVQTVTPTTFDPLSDWANLMRRRDVMKWGWVDIVGAQPNFDAPLFPAGGPVASTSLTGVDLFTNKREYLAGPRTFIPFPKLPKAGLNLLAGESLDLYMKVFELSDTVSLNARVVYMFPRFRMLMG